MSFQQLFLCVTFAIIASVFIEANERIFCNERLMAEVRSVIDDSPSTILEATLKCMRENIPDLEDSDAIVSCNGLRKVIELKYVLGVEEPMQFAECASSAIVDLEEYISDDERKRIDQVQLRAFKLYEKIQETKV